jgi:tRNA(Ser,Leu) C12 N-acetylase TAN1
MWRYELMMIKCVIFVKINSRFGQVDPVLIVDKMMEDVHVRNKELTRYCHKIMPVERAFKAEHFKMLDAVQELFEQKSRPGEIKSWSLNFKLRNNSKFNYKEVLRECEKIASGFGHFADIYYPQWTLSIEIANHLMCVGLSEKFKEYKEYKLHKRVPGEPR